MKAVLLIDFGSTYTKITAVDVEEDRLLGTASSFTTIETDVNDGLANARAILEEKTGKLDVIRSLACSSAAGGLRMIASGMVPNLTSEAAHMASLGAGAKVIKTYSYQLTREDIEEIEALAPDIFLLTGGTDGGNKDCIIENAKMLSRCKAKFPIVIAGNRSAGAECEEILEGREIFRCENVMPRLGEPNVEPVQRVIREIFLRRIISAKGLSDAAELVGNIIMPTPSAMMSAMELLSKGTENTPGLGELLAVDLGGATTDVYSMAWGRPKTPNTILKGLEEPYAKRSVEGDIGMRYSSAGIADAVGRRRLCELSVAEESEISDWLDKIRVSPDILPQTPMEQSIDDALASGAVETAISRHVGTMEEVYTPMGLAYAQTGKDLTEVDVLVLTGGAIVRNPRAREIASGAMYKNELPIRLKPKSAKVFLDKEYILSAMGLLQSEYPESALRIMKKELEDYGSTE